MRVCYVSTRMLFDTTARETARERMRVCTREEDLLVRVRYFANPNPPGGSGDEPVVSKSGQALNRQTTGAHDDSRRDLLRVLVF